ncbi:hypothetical protein [Algicella marina]|uniref:Uncharacterized protein n=1 Tax=Algicella marina TaxID=2683284 RepID=A0A6P1SZY9_9RHOB|nr:hypothetical protein [Algicella marina]QHQ36244.1 hypothetical protein GO499_14230 [Algicella marina]
MTRDDLLQYDQNFEIFVASYKPHLRSPGYEDSLRRAYTLDARFMEEFRILRRYLIADDNNWGEDITRHLSRQSALPGTFSPENAKLLARLYREHVKIFITGRFDSCYLDSIETIALFYIFHDIRTLWITGAYREKTSRLMDLVCARFSLNKRLPIGQTLRALSGTLILEVNQIQRCFTMYERYVSSALLQDLTLTGMLEPQAAPTDAVASRITSPGT